MPTLTTTLAALVLTIAFEVSVLWLFANVATQPPAIRLVLALGWPFLLVERRHRRSRRC